MHVINWNQMVNKQAICTNDIDGENLNPSVEFSKT